MVHLEADKKKYENVLVQELGTRAVSQGVVDTLNDLVIRDLLPLTDLGGTTTGSTSASGGYTSEYWRVDLRTVQRDNSTSSSANAYNEVVNVDLNRVKVIGVLGIQKLGEDAVSAVRFSLGSGAKIKDIWQLDGIAVGDTYWAENPAVYNSNNIMKVEFYLKSTAIIYHKMIGKAAEPKGETILGAE